MKIIDLLNKIANGEETPNKFKYDNLTFTKRYDGAYFDNDGDDLHNSLCIDFSNLNDVIEIIEEDKGIEKLKESESIENDTGTCLRNITNKINELIDYINNKD